jgi:antitoxin FitA
MAQLVVRDLEDDVKARLQHRARRHGRSVEEEVREILRDAVKDEGAERSRSAAGCGSASPAWG